MNEHIIRKRSGEAVDGDRTDWARLKAMTEAEIDAAIASDPDTFAMVESEWLGRESDAFRYGLIHAVGEGWRWVLVAADRHVIAEGPEAFDSRTAALDAIAAVRAAMVDPATRAA